MIACEPERLNHTASGAIGAASQARTCRCGRARRKFRTALRTSQARRGSWQEVLAEQDQQWRSWEADAEAIALEQMATTASVAMPLMRRLPPIGSRQDGLSIEQAGIFRIQDIFNRQRFLPVAPSMKIARDCQL